MGRKKKKNTIKFYTQEEFKKVVKRLKRKANIISILDYQNPDTEEEIKKHLVEESKEDKNIYTAEFDNTTNVFDLYDQRYNIIKKAFSVFESRRSVNFIDSQCDKGLDFYIVSDYPEICHAYAQFIIDFYGDCYEKPEIKLTPNMEVLYKLRLAYREITGEYSLLGKWRQEMALAENMNEKKYTKRRSVNKSTKNIMNRLFSGFDNGRRFRKR